MEDTAGPSWCSIDLADGPVREAHNADRPGKPGAMGDQADLVMGRGDAQERDAGSIWRPAWLDIERETRIDPAQ